VCSACRASGESRARLCSCTSASAVEIVISTCRLDMCECVAVGACSIPAPFFRNYTCVHVGIIIFACTYALSGGVGFECSVCAVHGVKAERNSGVAPASGFLPARAGSMNLLYDCIAVDAYSTYMHRTSVTVRVLGANDRALCRLLLPYAAYSSALSVVLILNCCCGSVRAVKAERGSVIAPVPSLSESSPARAGVYDFSAISALCGYIIAMLMVHSPRRWPA
jgi:hypothetical protein